MYGTYFKNSFCSRYGGRACDECEAGKFGFPNCKGKIFLNYFVDNTYLLLKYI